jgi:hypothetical protein
MASGGMLTLFAVALALVSQVHAQPFHGDDVRELHQQYYNIFQHGNRNAASHLWSKFLLDRSHQLTPEKLQHMFSGFCAVSGSPVSPQDRTRYRLNLDKVDGGKQRGYMYYCCWPCVCDTQDFIRVDTKNITTLGGETRQYRFAVLGNPCHRSQELDVPFHDAFGRGTTTLKSQAPEVRCSGNKLEGAYLSDHGYVIISMFFDEDPALNSMDESMFEGHCTQRAQAGYNSGMGEIFRKVAAISPIEVGVEALEKSCTSPVQCGGHSAASCSECPEGNGETWCNGDCQWLDGQCVAIELGCRTEETV